MENELGHFTSVLIPLTDVIVLLFSVLRVWSRRKRALTLQESRVTVRGGLRTIDQRLASSARVQVLEYWKKMLIRCISYTEL